MRSYVPLIITILTLACLTFGYLSLVDEKTETIVGHSSNKSAAISLHDFRQFCRDGNVAEIEKALLAGFDVNSRDAGGSTALHEAIMHYDVCKLLIDYGINVNAQRYIEYDGLTALHIACRVQAEPRVVRLLLDSGADPELLDGFGNKPIDYALQNVLHGGFSEKAEMLERAR